MIDLNTNKIVDVLESRDLKEVTEWLKQYPNIELVCRDGSIIYAKAITGSHKESIQVGDRFHILRNLIDYSKEYIKRILPNKVDVTDDQIREIRRENLKSKVKFKYSFDTKWDLIVEARRLREQGYTVIEVSKMLQIGNKTVVKYSKIDDNQKAKYENKSIDGAERYRAYEQKEILISRVKDLKKRGLSIARISRELSLDRKTVSKYIEIKGRFVHGSTGIKYISKLDPYKPSALELFNAGCSSMEIYESIKLDGYAGSDSLLRKFLNEFKKGLISEDNLYKEFISRKSLTSLLYKDMSKIESLLQDQLNRVLCTYPELGTLYSLVNDFKKILLGRNESDLDGWIEDNRRLNIREINSFISGIERDIDAVRNAIKYEYSNGLAEGSVNKIKVIKRIMYGRCSFEFLRKKILLNDFN